MNSEETITRRELEHWLTQISKSSDTGLYQHFKGMVVIKTGQSTCTEDGHTNFLYRELKVEQGMVRIDHEILWSRPMGMFLENVPFTSQPRFKLLTPYEAAELLYPVILNQNNKS